MVAVKKPAAAARGTRRKKEVAPSPEVITIKELMANKSLWTGYEFKFTDDSKEQMLAPDNKYWRTVSTANNRRHAFRLYKDVAGSTYFDRPGGQPIFTKTGTLLMWATPDAKVIRTPISPEEVALEEAAAKVGAMLCCAFGKHVKQSGADPEIFALSKDGQVVPAFEFLNKKNTKAGTFGDYYWDGYQAEYAPQPGACLMYFGDAIRSGLNKIYTALSAKFPEADLTLNNTVMIPPERLANDEEKYVMFGCSPSMNAYPDEGSLLQEVNPRAEPLRSAGGHLHFQFQPGNKQAIEQGVKILDSVLGVMCVSMFQYYDNPARRTRYGRAGEYRMPKHGVEYRVLSNAWLCHPGIFMLVYQVARGLLNGYSNWDKVGWQATEKETRDAINNCDVALAQSILKRNKLVFDAMLAAFIPVEQKKLVVDWANKMIFDGCHTALKNPDRPSDVWKYKSGTWSKHSEDKYCTIGSIIANNCKMED